MAAELTPVINNGKITDVVINNSGSGYVSPPDLEITSNTGDYAVLVPQVNDGKIVNVVINKSGAGYDKSTFIKVNSPGQDAEVFTTSMVGTSTCLRRTSIISKMMMVS